MAPVLLFAAAVGWLVLFASPTATAQQSAQRRRACEDSGMCSVGVSRRWVGDIKEGPALKSMLEAVTFRKELILTIYMPQTGQAILWLDPVHQLHQELLDQGYAHHIFVTLDEEHCKQLLLPDASCVWDSSLLPINVLEGEQALWHQRWKLLARAVRLGYNVMSVDTDFIFFRDPYVHLKAGEPGKAQIMCMPEGGSVFNCNGGFMYVQNARPDGPVSWVFKHVVMSTLRRGDDNLTYINEFSKMKVNCLNFDQSLIMDALASAGVGRPLAYMGVFACKPGATFTSRLGTTLTHDQVKANIEALVSAEMRTNRTPIVPEGEWLKTLGLPQLPGDDVNGQITTLTVPNLDYGYPEELGGRMAPKALGALSQAFVDQLRSDCPSCPWWPEKRGVPQPDPLDKVLGPQYREPKMTKELIAIFRDPGVPTERLMLVPRWISSSLPAVRRGTFLGPQAPVQGPFLMSHIHAWHLQTSRHHKIMLRKVLGRYNWTTAGKVAKLGGVQSAYGLRRDVRRVLMLSPDVDLSRTRSWEELAKIIAGLMQVAQLSRRTLVMPDLPCETAWLHDEHARKDMGFKKNACVVYTFHRDATRSPLPVIVPVDERGELVGGWARRLMSLDPAAASSSASSSGGADAWWRPAEAAAGRAGQQQQGDGRDQRASQSSTTFRFAMLPDPEDLPANSSRSSRRLLQQGQGVGEAWWQRQRLKAVIPAFWDPTCTQDMKVMVSPEFHHWVKHNEHAAGVQLQHTPANTIFQAAPGDPALQLVPPQPPGGDAAAMPRGMLVDAQSKMGWSWADVQVGVQVRDVVDELRRVAQQPLVYVSHPIVVMGEDASDPSAVYPDTGGDALGPDQHKHKRQLQAARVGGVGVTGSAARQSTTMRPPQDELEQLRERLTAFGGSARDAGGAATAQAVWEFLERERDLDDDLEGLEMTEGDNEAEDGTHAEQQQQQQEQAGEGAAADETNGRPFARSLLLDPGDVAAAGVSQQQQRGNVMRRPEAALAHINRRIRRTGCKAVFVDPERPQVVALAPILQGRVKDRRITTKN